MLPALVSPFHDTDGLMFSHLKAIAPQLKSIFARAYLNISPFTQRAQAVHVDRLQQDSFFQLTHNPPGTPIGDQFLSVYARAAHDSPPAQVLHLCFLHRVAFALQTQHKDRFVADVLQAADQQLPLLFQRSPEAWDTHPRNYREIEQVATQIGEHLFNQRLDFAWCHLALQAQQLQGILPRIRGHDLDVLTEIVLLLKDSIETRDVDWLAWQDPFLHSRDPGQLKQERENSLQETQKRLGRLIPVLQRLVESTSAGAFARAGRKARSTELTTAMGSKGVRFTFGANNQNVVTVSSASLWMLAQSLSNRDGSQKRSVYVQNRALRQAQDASSRCDVRFYCRFLNPAPGMKCSRSKVDG